MSNYIFDNAAPQAAQRLDGLSRLFDPWTIQHLERTGVGAGWRCLEVGGGGGSIARWLSRRVGCTGHVLVTDIDPRFLTSFDQANIEVRRHDIAMDELPERAFDLVHERLVLMHILERERALERMLAALKPGGWIVLEDYAHHLLDRSALISDACHAALLRKVDAAVGQLLHTHGADIQFACSLYSRLQAHGLVEVGMEGYFDMAQGRSPGARLRQASLQQVREEAVSAGLIGSAEMDAVIKLLDDPEFAAPTQPILLTAWGRRPLSAE
jgi:SAM-dependent methyltransferase